MDKQPDKLDVLMDWFLGDAKEITESQKAINSELTVILEKLERDKSSLGETADSLRLSLVETQRSINSALSQDAKEREAFISKLNRTHAHATGVFSRRVLFITAACSIFGAALGSAVVTILLK